MSKTLAQKLWDAHVVRVAPGEPDLLYVDLHLVHEVTSPQAFEGLRLSGRRVRRPDLTLATMDHNVPTQGGARGDTTSVLDTVPAAGVAVAEQIATPTAKGQYKVHEQGL